MTIKYHFNPTLSTYGEMLRSRKGGVNRWRLEKSILERFSAGVYPEVLRFHKLGVLKRGVEWLEEYLEDFLREDTADSVERKKTTLTIKI